MSANPRPTQSRLRRWVPSATKVEHRCRWCGRGLGDWHDRECSPGQAADGRVHERDCMRLEYHLVVADPQSRYMHTQLRRQWGRETQGG